MTPPNDAVERLRAMLAEDAPWFQISDSEISAIVTQFDRLAAERDAAVARADDEREKVVALQCAAVVHASMLRGSVAKLSMRSWAHTHALTNHDNWTAMTLQEAEDHIRSAP